ncbi:MAG: Nif3-like dinuclear metal center hexameric protein [Candidatus Thiodiazotropha sp.]|jgi:dinuclear metal center YbgI/SA1388 family protein
MIDLLTLEAYCNSLLSVEAFDDYCPNGVQVEASFQVQKLMVGVTACQALIEAAEAWGADALLVHHGYFWKGEAASLRGLKGRRISRLFRNEISLLAYHLPLDAHAVYGNNRQLGNLLRFSQAEPVLSGPGLIWRATLPQPLPPTVLGDQLNQALGREPLHISPNQRPLTQIGWCTGAAQGYIESAAELGLDAYISGEISEPTVHIARELDIHYFAAGHHATERYGVEALGRHLAAHFELEWCFKDIDNPV